jgi:hypothetical protein
LYGFEEHKCRLGWWSWGNGPYGSYSASSDATEEIVEVVLKKALICLVRVARDVGALGKEVGVTRGRRGHPAERMI